MAGKPQRPQIAFTFDMLDWAEALLLECQVAVKDLCKALCFRSPHLVVKVCVHGIYPACDDCLWL